MKRNILLFVLSCLCLVTSHVTAQNPAIPKTCIDSVITKSSDSLVNFFKSKSFSLVHAASLSMESEYESGIIVNLKKGEWYVLALVGAKTSKLFQITMYDWAEQRVAYEKQKSFDKESNILIFSYRPLASGYHMIKPLQVNKKNKNICGQVMLFKKDQP